MKKLASLLTSSLLGAALVVGCTIGDGPDGSNGDGDGDGDVGGQGGEDSGGDGDGDGTGGAAGGAGGAATGGTGGGEASCGEPPLEDKPAEDLGLLDDPGVTTSYTDSNMVAHDIKWDIWEIANEWIWLYETVNETIIDPVNGFTVGQNDTTNIENSCLWSRLDWHKDGMGKSYYCLAVSDAASKQEAIDATAPDSSDVTAGGCNGFAWTELVPD